jgi:predicted ester cyclase
LFEAIPDATFDLVTVYIGDAGVGEESVLRGTHQGTWMGVALAGRKIELPLIIVFPMLEGALLGERLYFDLATLVRQLGRTTN